MAAYLPTSSLPSPDGGSKSHRMVQVRPDSAATGANFNGTVSFSFKPASGEFISFAESYVSVRSTWDNAAGPPANLIAGDNISMSRYGWVNAFSTVATYFADQLVERTDHPAQSAVVQYGLGRTSSWAETVGSAYAASASFAARQAFVIGGASYDVKMSPPQGSWQSTHLVRGCPIRLEMTVDPNWERRVAESTGASKVPGTDYNVNVDEILLWVSVWQPEDGTVPPITSDILDTIQLRTQATAQTGITSTQLSFGVESSSYTVVNLFQPSTAGFDTLTPATNTEDADLQSIAVDWHGTRRPQIPFNANFSTGAGLVRLYGEAYIASSVGETSDAGALLSLSEWSADPVFCQKLISGHGSFDDRLNVEINYRTPYTGVAFSITLYPARIVISYGADGLVSRAVVAKTAAELSSAALMLA